MTNHRSIKQLAKEIALAHNLKIHYLWNNHLVKYKSNFKDYIHMIMIEID